MFSIDCPFYIRSIFLFLLCIKKRKYLGLLFGAWLNASRMFIHVLSYLQWFFLILLIFYFKIEENHLDGFRVLVWYLQYVKHIAYKMAKRGWNVVVENHRGLGGVSITVSFTIIVPFIQLWCICESVLDFDASYTQLLLVSSINLQNFISRED